MEYSWSFNVVTQNLDVFAQAALVTIGLTVAVCVIGTLLGLVLTLLEKTGNKLASALVSVFVNVVRAVPPLVWLVWFYYCVPILTDVKLDSFATAVVALSVGGAPFLAEIIRAGIEAVPKGQYESARVLGFTRMQAIRRIILPQAVRLMIPSLTNEYITILKLTSLASVIAVTEIVHSANTLVSNSYRPLEVYTALAAVYVVLVVPLSLAAKKLEGKKSKIKVLGHAGLA